MLTITENNGQTTLTDDVFVWWFLGVFGALILLGFAVFLLTGVDSFLAGAVALAIGGYAATRRRRTLIVDPRTRYVTFRTMSLVSYKYQRFAFDDLGGDFYVETRENPSFQSQTPSLPSHLLFMPLKFGENVQLAATDGFPELINAAAAQLNAALRAELPASKSAKELNP